MLTLTNRLSLEINLALQSGEPEIDWYFIRSQCRSLQEADAITCQLINQLNFTVTKNGEEYRPNCLEAK